jgi:hypothetical protein
MSRKELEGFQGCLARRHIISVLGQELGQGEQVIW